eukprot:283489-Chlamydomonas_euryale.AAC.1
MVMRDGGGFGEFSTGSTHRSSSMLSVPRCGNSDATWPSGPTPSSIRSKMGRPASLRGRTDGGRATSLPGVEVASGHVCVCVSASDGGGGEGHVSASLCHVIKVGMVVEGTCARCFVTSSRWGWQWRARARVALSRHQGGDGGWRCGRVHGWVQIRCLSA